MANNSQKHIAFVSPPFSGHLNPLLELAQCARNKGFKVSFVTSEKKRRVIESLGLHCDVLPCLSNSSIENIANTTKKIGSNPLKLQKQLKNSLKIAINAKKELSNLWEHSVPNIIVADSVTVIPGLIAESKNIPWITTMATPFVLESFRGTPPYLGGLKEGSSVFHKLRDNFGNRAIRISKRIFAYTIRKELNALGIKNIYRLDGTEAAYSPFAILGIGTIELEFKKDWPQNFSMIGPLFKDFENRQSILLPERKHKVLITLGTHLGWAKKNLEENIKWLASKRPDILFVGTFGNSEGVNAPRQLSHNVLLIPFLSYNQYMEQFDVIIHHGGAGITNACLWHAKPSIVAPHDYDQFDYAARISAKGLGLRIKKLKSNKTLYFLDRALQGEFNSRLLKFQSYAKNYNTQSNFLEIINNFT